MALSKAREWVSHLWRMVKKALTMDHSAGNVSPKRNVYKEFQCLESEYRRGLVSVESYWDRRIDLMIINKKQQDELEKKQRRMTEVAYNVAQYWLLINSAFIGALYAYFGDFPSYSWFVFTSIGLLAGHFVRRYIRQAEES